MTIGDQIKRLRCDKNLTQEAVAISLAVTSQTVAKWESNQASPSTLNLLKLADLFQVQLQDLTTVDDGTASMQEYFIQKIKEEENLNRARKQLQLTFLSEFRIILFYIILGFLCWGSFHLIGIPDYIWKWIVDHYALCISGCVSALAILCNWKRLSWLVFLGTTIGIIVGNLAGYITDHSSPLGFNTGWIFFLLCVNIATIVGIALEIMHHKSDQAQSFLPAKGRKVLTTLLRVLLILLFLSSVYFSGNRLAFNSAAEKGYQEGLEIGIQDASSGKSMNATLKKSTIQDTYAFGSASYNGYAIYWPSGYLDGYASKTQEVNSSRKQEAMDKTKTQELLTGVIQNGRTEANS